MSKDLVTNREKVKHGFRTHEHLVFLVKKKLRNMGYKIYERNDRLRIKAKERGVYYSALSQVDVYAEKNGEAVVAEVHCNAHLVNQLQRYKKLGKVILVLPIDMQGIEVWGLKELEVDKLTEHNKQH
ncbi:MAG: hypothetical protein ACP5LN_11075 [Thermoproteota archaeon]